ncbi:cytidine deaminase [Entomospira entomophila]|uniref:Cytidine deaminase n=1 Tax=Entomospira entomophila TaxID=2719988 RepID=A0A968GBN1_9SPIO|nr:cytidine deaminase [Entomospira entomophilus]NIZ40406.1 cytidine deaminase [Entomospira entomophilus]WDI35964.1 cytidine deaminase [Entomospira entomophilus]
MLDLHVKQFLIQEAIASSKQSYSPYSGFAVGAALLSKSGEVTRGANIENISFGLSNCAERTAVYTALTSGLSDFKAIAIYSPSAQEHLQPCGACRQVLAEFTHPDFILLLANKNGDFIEKTLQEIFPMSFSSLGNAKSSL